MFSLSVRHNHNILNHTLQKVEIFSENKNHFALFYFDYFHLQQTIQLENESKTIQSIGYMHSTPFSQTKIEEI